jgi:hypothetical protein
MQSIDKQGNDMQSGGVQRMAVFPLGELKSRPKWCAVESRVENVGGRRGEGNGRSQAALQSARGGFRGGQVRVDLDPSGGGEALMARQVRRRSWPSESVWLHRLVPESTTSNSSHPSWLTQPLSPRVTSEITPSTIFHPRQPFPTNYFVNHGISSSSRSSYRRQSCSPREFTFRLLFSTTKVYPNSLNLLNTGDFFTEISSLTYYYLFSRPGT